MFLKLNPFAKSNVLFMTLGFFAFLPSTILVVCGQELSTAKKSVESPNTSQALAPQILLSPTEHLGYQPGADFRLANWKTIASYFEKLDDQSPRVQVETFGRTTLDRPMILVTISEESTVGHLSEFQKFQRMLADPRQITDKPTEDRILNRAKPVVLITGTIHSSETASSLMLMELAHELASGQESWAREVLQNVIVLIMPSVNPDGVDIVQQWYEKTIGKPWEGSGLPTLYHHYAGHDTNRDFYSLNLKETVNISKVLYDQWFPTICWDVHQMGSAGARLFVPPFFDPTNPNVDPRITQSILMIGSHMAVDLATAGKKGVLHSAMYDNWWNGGNRTTPQRHNMVAILTEAASVRLASPIFFNPSDLKAGSRGFSSHEPTVNFPDPWPGGWWHLRDIVDYELIAGRSLLTLAARYNMMFQSNYLKMGRDQIMKGESEAPYGWMIAPQQDDPGRTWDFLEKLVMTGVELHQTESATEIHGVKYPAGSWFLPARQPYRAHLKDMMERQKYPNRFTANGQAETPYDVAGWTLPLLMGVDYVELSEPMTVQTHRTELGQRPKSEIRGELDQASHVILANRSNDDLVMVQQLLKAGIKVRLTDEPVTLEKKTFAVGSAIVELSAKARETLKAESEKLLCQADAVGRMPEAPFRHYEMQTQRIGLYQPFQPSMDEGWTRLVLERLRIPFQTIHRDDLLAGRLNERFDSILIPSISNSSLRNGYGPNETAPEFVGGLANTQEQLAEFVDKGGVLIALEDSCDFVIQELSLPVEDAVGKLPSREFYAPGSIFAAETTGQNPLTYGMPDRFSVYFDRSLALKSSVNTNTIRNVSFESVVNYHHDKKQVLQSGWLLGPEKMAGLSAVGECRMGKGRVILFGFPPQNRAQTYGTFRLLVNSLMRGGMTLHDKTAAPVNLDPKP